MSSDPLETVISYHEATKHHFHRSARSLGFLDWSTQPEPFRRFDGVETCPLGLPDSEEGPTWDSLFEAAPVAAAVTRESLSRFFYHSLALSAWKQVVSPEGEVLSRWALRVNPSSGNLHPTEGYLICGAVDGFLDEPGVFHYAPDDHLLERRGLIPVASYVELQKSLPEGAFLVGLSSIHWREAWKYGERAFRYCQHDVGHAMAAIALAARCLGWEVHMLGGLTHPTLESLLGTGLQSGPEKEHADCLLMVIPGGGLSGTAELQSLDTTLQNVAQTATFSGMPNDLSSSHQKWPIIDEVAAATERGVVDLWPQDWAPPQPLSDRQLPAHSLIRNRRSAVSMDGETTLEREDFLHILTRLLPDQTLLPYRIMGSDPAVSLILFVHRVKDLDSGLYCLVRHPDHEASLRRELRPEFSWSLPTDLPLFLLAAGDTTEAAQRLSCNQAIAADGVFSLGMLAHFQPGLEDQGPAFYRNLFWETGMIGQMLYLEAEAAGIRGTGIGCFFDDEFHRMLGLKDNTWQSLYHFTVGGPVNDNRLQTAGAYDHLEK